MVDDKQTFSADDLALVGEGTDADPGDKTPAGTDKAGADKAPPPDKGGKAAAAEVDADAVDAGADDASEQDEGDAGDQGEKRPGRTHLDDGEEAEDDAADGKKATDKAAAPWRDAALKSLEAKLSKKGTDKAEVAKAVDAIRKQLARYGTPEAAILAGMDAQTKLRAGQGKEKPGEDASPEEIAEYRENEGLPPEPAKYSLPKVEYTALDGKRVAHQWTDRDQPLIDSIKEVAFKLDMPQATLNSLTEWYVNAGNQAHKWQNEAIGAIDKTDKKATREALREEWGDEYTGRVELATRLVNDTSVFPDEVGAMLWSARTPDGRLLMNQADFLKFLAEPAVERYGEGGLITGDRKAKIDDREQQILAIMKTDFDKYLREGLDVELAAIDERKAGRRGRAA